MTLCFLAQVQFDSCAIFEYLSWIIHRFGVGRLTFDYCSPVSGQAGKLQLDPSHFYVSTPTVGSLKTSYYTSLHNIHSVFTSFSYPNIIFLINNSVLSIKYFSLSYLSLLFKLIWSCFTKRTIWDTKQTATISNCLASLFDICSRFIKSDRYKNKFRSPSEDSDFYRAGTAMDHKVSDT